MLAAQIVLANQAFIAGDPEGERTEFNGTGLESFDATGKRTFLADGGNVYVSGSVESTDYVEAESGWRLDTEQAQFTNLNTIDELGADVTSTRVLKVDGQDLEADILPSLSYGAHAYGQDWGGGNSKEISSSNANGMKIANFSPGEVDPGRLYLVMWHFTMANGFSGTTVKHYLTYSTDGTEAIDSDSTLPGSEFSSLAGIDASAGDSFNDYGPTLSGWTVWNPSTAQAANTSLALVLNPNNGDGAQAKNNNGSTKAEIMMIDCGPVADAPNAFALRNQDGGSSGGSNTASYTKTWSPTWGRSFDGDGSIWKNYGNETDDLYQGYYSGTHGNTKSMVGYDASDIQSKTSGATIKKVQLTFRVKHSYYGSGLDVRIGTHNQGGKPNSFSNVSAEVHQENGVNAGSTVTVTLPDSVGNDFKNGNVRGITFGPGQNTDKRWYGYLYGPGSGSAPKLKITYEK